MLISDTCFQMLSGRGDRPGAVPRRQPADAAGFHPALCRGDVAAEAGGRFGTDTVAAGDPALRPAPGHRTRERPAAEGDRHHAAGREPVHAGDMVRRSTTSC